MINIIPYRNRIGCFNQNKQVGIRKCLSKKMVEYTPLELQLALLPNILLYVLVCYIILSGLYKKLKSNPFVVRNPKKQSRSKIKFFHNSSYSRKNNQTNKHGLSQQSESGLLTRTKSFDGKSLLSNFYAKITYGNKAAKCRGLKNLHLNIRSIRNKISDVKNILGQHKPHFFGISECELTKIANFVHFAYTVKFISMIDERCLHFMMKILTIQGLF